MSTTFEVFPSKKLSISADSLVDRINKVLDEITAKRNLKEIRLKADNQTQNSNIKPEDETEFTFQIATTKEFLTVSKHESTQLQIDRFKEEIKPSPGKKTALTKIINSLTDYDYYYVIRRSAGSSFTYSFVYGFVAKVLAELTDGIIFSDDGAWDYSKFPSFAQNFEKWYWNPNDPSNDVEYTEWAKKGLKTMKRNPV